MTEQLAEFDVLQQLMPELEAEGYEVYLHPRRQLLPRFFQDFMPDAIALRSDKKLAIEVISKSRDGQKKSEKAASLFKGHDDWELRVVWVTPAGTPVTLQSQTQSQIRTRITEVKELTERKHFGPAFLLAWATLEAIGRVLLPRQFQRPQTPARLVQVLASEGYITPSEADVLRALADKRNKLVHGELMTRVSKTDINRMVEILGMLIKMSGKQPAD